MWLTCFSNCCRWLKRMRKTGKKTDFVLMTQSVSISCGSWCITSGEVRYFSSTSKYRFSLHNRITLPTKLALFNASLLPLPNSFALPLIINPSNTAVDCIVCVLCDCLEWLFWFYNTQLKSSRRHCWRKGLLYLTNHYWICWWQQFPFSIWKPWHTQNETRHHF